jgi:hypothetical protein
MKILIRAGVLYKVNLNFSIVEHWTTSNTVETVSKISLKNVNYLFQ